MINEELKELAKKIGRMSKTHRDEFFDIMNEERVEFSRLLLEDDVERTIFGIKLEKDTSRYYDMIRYSVDVSEIVGIDGYCNIDLCRRVSRKEDENGENLPLEIRFEASISFDGMNISVIGESVYECENKLIEAFYARKFDFESDTNSFERKIFKK